MNPGSSLGPYRIVRLLGTGGMGEVWLADDTRLDRQVALKTVRPAATGDTRGRERLLREARAAAALSHPGIAAVHDVLDIDGEILIVFEFVEGETLLARLRRGPLPIREALDITSQLAAALTSAHRHGIVHRDLKPANVILGADGRAKVLDFGVARMLPTGTATTVTGGGHETAAGLVGTPGYAAPEQWVSPQVDGRADLFALGVVLFEMVAGRRPYEGADPLTQATSMLTGEPKRLSAAVPSVPRALDDLVSQMLSRNPHKRPPSAGAVLSVLESLHAPPPPPTPWWPLAIALVLVALMTGLVSWLRVSGDAASLDRALAPVVAVLPMNNLSGDPSREYIGAGVADSLITSLATLPSVTVLSRAAVAEARVRAPDLGALVKDLGATFLVEGSVQQEGDRLQVSLNLVRARDRSVAWSESFEGVFAQIFDLQSRLARAVTAALTLHAAAGHGGGRPEQEPTTNPAALEAYWRGRELLERRDVSGNLDRAVEFLTRATTSDPKFGLAYAALGEASWMQYIATREQPWVQRAIDAGTTALRLNPERPAVRYAVALTLEGTGRLDDAVDELQRALVIQPLYDDARRLLGKVLARQGKVDEAISEFNKAIAIRPEFWGNYSELGFALYNASRFVEAEAAFRKVTELRPDSMMGFQQLGAVYQNLGQHDRALEYYARALAIQPTAQAYSNVGAIHHLRREFTQATDAYRQALELRPNAHTTWRNLGDALTQMRDTSAARDAYQRAIRIASAETAVDPNDAGVLSLLAVYYAKVGDWERARTAYARARILGPGDGAVLFRSAEVEALARQDEAARGWLQQAVDLGFSRSRIAEEEDFARLRERAWFRTLVQSPAQGDRP